MNLLRSVSTLLMLPLIVSGCAVDPASAAKAPAVGDKAADFTLNTLDDKKVQLSELLKSGPVVVVQLRGWVGYQCPLCTLQVGDILGRQNDFLAKGARVVLVYPGEAAKLKEYAKEFIAGKSLPENYYLVTDPDLKFVNSWGLRWDAKDETAYPSTFVIDETGIVRFAQVSKTHGDRAKTKDVLAALPAKAEPEKK
jgi:peroxiredoxin Q/BCP